MKKVQKDALKLYGRKYQKTLQNLRAIIDSYLPAFNKQSTIPLSTHDDNLITVLGSTKTVSRNLKSAIEIGLLSIEDSSYSFNNTSSHSRTYKTYPKMAKKIIEVTLPTEIPPMTSYMKFKDVDGTVYEINEDLVNDSNVKTILSKIKFGYVNQVSLSNCNLHEIATALYMKYPKLSSFQAILDRDNISNPSWDQTRCIPKITINKSGRCTKIGIRATSVLCSTKKEGDRKIILDHVYGKSFEESDVSSSILRLTKLINTGTWVSNDEDLYKKVFWNFKSKEEREGAKSMVMRLYFCKSDSDGWAKAVRAKNNFFATKEDFSKVRARMLKEVGESLGGDLFFYESILYYFFTKALKAEGLKPLQVYDCWYTTKKINDFDGKMLESYELLKKFLTK